MINLTQRDYNILKQGTRELYIKLNLLNRNKKILASIENILISDNLSIDAESAIRRNYNCELKFEKQDWNTLNRYKMMTYLISPYVGIRYNVTDEIIWYSLGIYAFDNRNYTYDASNSTLSLSCSDMMCYLNGTLGGELKDIKITIDPENNIRNVIVSLLKECNIMDYDICEINHTTNSTKEYSTTTYYDIIKELLDLYSGYEMYFSIDGIFTINKIPTCETDTIILNDAIIEPLLISQSGSFSYENIYNHIKVYGMEIEADRDIDTCTYENNVYAATIDNLTTYENFETYCISIPSINLKDAQLNINGIGSKYIVKDDNVKLSDGDLLVDKYSFRYRRLTDDFLLLGQYQVVGEAWDINPKSPFTVDNLGYEIYHECSGSDYEKIYSNELANQRARYEIWKSTNIQNTISLQMMYVPWLDVNTKISYTDKETNETNQYIIKQINGNFMESTMSVSLIRFYEEYPNII